MNDIFAGAILLFLSLATIGLIYGVQRLKEQK